jgi:hypothetical protein
MLRLGGSCMKMVFNRRTSIYYRVTLGEFSAFSTSPILAGSTTSLFMISSTYATPT